MGPSVPMEASDGDPGNVAFKLELKGVTQADLETKFAELGIPAGSTLTLEGIVAQKVGDAEGAPDLGVEAEHWDALFRYRCKDNKRMGCQLHLGYQPFEPVVSSVCKPVPAALIVTCGGSGSPAHFLTPRFNLEMSLSDLCTMLVRAADRPECCRMYALSPSHASGVGQNCQHWLQLLVQEILVFGIAMSAETRRNLEMFRDAHCEDGIVVFTNTVTKTVAKKSGRCHMQSQISKAEHNADDAAWHEAGG